jgi:outer membrane lipoprotein-sorting protein
MDSVGKNFHSFTAQFTQKKYTAILREFDTPETGEFYYSRAKDGSALLRQEAKSPGRKILTVKGGEAIFYQPDIKQAQIADLGKYKNLAEFLALGIGQSPAKLQENFDISYQGNGSINGAACSMLLLKPKAANIASRFSSITLWVKRSNGLPIQNKLLEPSGDYVLLTFFDEKLNVKISDATFEQKLPRGVDIQRIQ